MLQQKRLWNIFHECSCHVFLLSKSAELLRSIGRNLQIYDFFTLALSRGEFAPRRNFWSDPPDNERDDSLVMAVRTTTTTTRDIHAKVWKRKKKVETLYKLFLLAFWNKRSRKKELSGRNVQFFIRQHLERVAKRSSQQEGEEDEDYSFSGAEVGAVFVAYCYK